jgi:hypothetical protein
VAPNAVPPSSGEQNMCQATFSTTAMQYISPEMVMAATNYQNIS